MLQVFLQHDHVIFTTFTTSNCDVIKQTESELASIDF